MGTIKRTFANSLTGTGKLSATNLDSNIPAANIADASVTNVTTLPESLGQAIKSVAGNPPSQALGDIWYDTNTGKLKNYGLTAAAWASGGNLPTAKQALTGFGIQTAAVGAAGYTTTHVNTSEEYNGSSWTASGNLTNSKANLGGFGVQTAGAVAAGSPTFFAGTEEYNGSTWSPGGNLGTGRYYTYGSGTLTAGLIFGGNNARGLSEEYDGTSWTAGGALASEQGIHAGAGTQTATVSFAGQVGPRQQTQEYDGTSWTLVSSMGTGRYFLSGAGTQTSALAVSGIIPGGTILDNVEQYDGTNWTSTTAVTTGALGPAGCGASNTSTLKFGGASPPSTSITATEEFTGAFNAIKTVTTS